MGTQLLLLQENGKRIRFHLFKVRCKDTLKGVKLTNHPLDPVVGSIGESYGKTSAQVLIRYAIERGLIVIPKSVTKSRLAANAEVFDFELSENDLARLKDLERGFKVVELAANKDHKYYPFRDNYSE